MLDDVGKGRGAHRGEALLQEGMGVSYHSNRPPGAYETTPCHYPYHTRNMKWLTFSGLPHLQAVGCDSCSTARLRLVCSEEGGGNQCEGGQTPLTSEKDGTVW